VSLEGLRLHDPEQFLKDLLPQWTLGQALLFEMALRAIDRTAWCSLGFLVVRLRLLFCHRGRTVAKSRSLSGLKTESPRQKIVNQHFEGVKSLIYVKFNNRAEVNSSKLAGELKIP